MSSTINRFEDLHAWQFSRNLTREIYAVTQEGRFAKDFGLRDQIQRAAVSIMSNIAEGHERIGPAEFHRFLSIAKGSCAEVRSLLYVASDINYLTELKFGELLSETERVGRVVEGLRAAMARRISEKRGYQS